MFDYSNIEFKLLPFHDQEVERNSMKKTQHTREYEIMVELLLERRRKAGLTQTELGERLEQTQSFISKIERRELRLDVIQLRLFCVAMECSFVGFVRELETRIRQEQG